MSLYKYETYATNIYDNFEDNSLTKNWENYENLWKTENGEGVVKENSYIDFINIGNTSDVKKKKCLVIRATGDNYTLVNEPKGLKTGKSQRVGGGVKSKDLMGPGEYNLRVKFTTFDSVCNAIWLFNYLEIEPDDVRHIKNPDYCLDNDLNNVNIINPEIDFELLSNNECRCNIFKSTEVYMKKILLISIAGLLMSGCYMVPLALIGPATSGFTTTSMMQAAISSSASHMVKKATEALEKGITNHTAMLSKGFYASGWNSEYSAASRLYEQIMSKFQRFQEQNKSALKNPKDKYHKDRMAGTLKDMQDEFKEFMKKMQNISREKPKQIQAGW